jgi:hypothetical protein
MWSLADIARAAGTSRKNIEYFLERLPKDALALRVQSVGKGGRRAFSAAEAVLFAGLVELSELGLPPHAAINAAVRVRSWANEHVDGYSGRFRGIQPAYFLVTADGVKPFELTGHIPSGCILLDCQAIASRTAMRLWDRFSTSTPHEPIAV